MKPVRVNVISVLKACGNHVGNLSQLTRISPSPTSPSPTQPQSQVSGTRILPSSSSSNPCLDLYFHRPMGSGIHSNLEFHETLTKQLLPLAWSHNPLTTLKLICNLLDRWKDGSKSDNEAFYAAAFWLHHNHPKTLACNLLPIASAFGHILDVLDILSRVLLQGNGQQQVDQYSMTWTRKEKNQNFQSQQFRLTQNAREKNRTTCSLPPSPRQSLQIKAEKAKEKASALLKRRKTAAVANKAVERYHGDSDYRYLHDRVSDLMAECLKHDIQEFNQHQQQRHIESASKRPVAAASITCNLNVSQISNSEQEHNQNKKKMKTLELNITGVADYFRFMSPHMDQLLYETVAMKVFTLGESEFSNPMSVQRRLRKEVLVPLRRALAPANQEGATANKWGYDQRLVYGREPDTPVSVVHKYMVALRTTITAAESKSESVSESMIEAGAVLPHRIVRYAVEYNGLYKSS
ncbi:uncharacterized protein LOC110761473 [Prunus avium]|uniref:Uncharacterized protein LOC110761473 n=1 Tax=Prunus avium TaxID=42229 RepID=A0A6P5T0N1_PRUAV|nr:uncharacterized protein LOC110761473 [Prunus avium]